MWGLSAVASGLSMKGLGLPLLGVGLIAFSAYMGLRDYRMTEAGAARAELDRLEDVARHNQAERVRLKAGYAALRKAEHKARQALLEADRKARSPVPQGELPKCPVDCVMD